MVAVKYNQFFPEMKTTCSDNGAAMQYVSTWTIQYYLAAMMMFTDLATVYKKSDFERYYDLTTYCLAQNFDDLTQFNAMDYDAVVAYVQANYATLSVNSLHCSWAWLWRSGEPNGGISEDCVFLDKGYDYKYVDVSCDTIGTWAGFVCYFHMEYV